MDFANYIDPQLLATVPVLHFLGYAFKRSTLIKDKHIPLLLAVVGSVLAMLWVLSGPTQSIFLAMFTAATQGILCAGTAVFAHQVIKQGGKPHE